MKQVFCLAALLAMGAAVSLESQTAPKHDPWAGVRFLLGVWDAKTKAGSAQASGSGAYSFRLELNDHVLARHSGYDACKGPEDFNCRHTDLLYLFPEGPDQALKAIYFDNEGHVIHYTVASPRPGTVVLLSEAAPWPQFRLTYELEGNIMTGRFQIKMP